MGEANGNYPMGLEAALLLATDTERGVFKDAFMDQPVERREELAARGVFLVHEKKEKGNFTAYKFADGTEIYVMPCEFGIVAAKASFPTGPIVEVRNVRYLALEHEQSDTLPHDTRLGHAKLLTIVGDLSHEKERLVAERYSGSGSLQHALVTNPTEEHKLLNKFLLSQRSLSGYIELSGQGRILVPCERPSRDTSNFYRGILRPVTY